MSILRSKHSGWTWEGKRTPFGGSSGGGSAGPTNTTVQNTNIPEYARPYVESMLGTAQQQVYTFGPPTAATPDITTQIGTDDNGQPIYQTTPGTPASSGEITGFKPYVPYGATVDAAGNITNTAQEQAAAAVAPFSPLQQQVFQGAAQMRLPGQYAYGSNLAGQSGYGALGATQEAGPLMNEALGYGAAGAMYGGTGAQQAMRAAQQTGRQAQMYGGLGSMYGGQAAQQAQQGYTAGERFTQQATDPNAVQAYMSPYVEQALAPQLKLLGQQQALAAQDINAKAVAAGAFGGNRATLAQGLNAQNYDFARQQAIGQGYEKAFQNAQQQQQFGANLGIQGLQAGYQGTGMGIQGAQTGLQGVGAQQAAGQLGLAGTAQGMQGAQAGLQGVQGAIGAGQYGLQGYGQATQSGQALANIGQQELAGLQSIYGLQSQLGGQQQTQQQNMVNQAIQNYAMQQQYPMQQLANMSNLLRGLPMQSATTQSYQAAPSAISQLGGLGLTAAAGYGLMKKKGGVIKDKRSDGLDDLGLYNVMKKAH